MQKGASAGSLLNCPLALLADSEEGLALPGFFFQSHSEDTSCSIPGTAEKGQEAAPGAAGREQRPSLTHSIRRSKEFSPCGPPELPLAALLSP